MVAPDARVPRITEVIEHEVSETGETILYDEDARQLLVLNDVGAAVWLLVDGRRSVDEIVGFVSEHVKASPDQVRADVVEFLSDLASRGLVDYG